MKRAIVTTIFAFIFLLPSSSSSLVNPTAAQSQSSQTVDFTPFEDDVLPAWLNQHSINPTKGQLIKP
jgi:hypothetical protein